MTEDLTRPAGLPPLESYWSGIQEALRHGAETCTLDTLSEMVQNGRVQYWPCGPSTVILTQVVGSDTLHFWVAAGRMQDLEKCTPLVLNWAREQGYTRATLTGRPGWLRSFLSRTGWTQSRLVAMELAL